MLASLSDLSLGSLALLTAILCVLFAWVGSIFLRPVLRLFVSSGGQENDVIGYVLSSFGVLYGILLGLTAVAAYQNWSTVDANVTQEASALISTYQTMGSFPEPDRSQIREMLRDLAGYEVDTEWPLLRQGLPATGAREKTDAIAEKLQEMEGNAQVPEFIRAQAFDQFNSFLEQRRLRLYSAGAGIPGILWYVVILGALINMVLIWLLNARLVAQMFLSGLLALFLGATILLIGVLSKPFEGQAGVSPDALAAAHVFMSKE